MLVIFVIHSTLRRSNSATIRVGAYDYFSQTCNNLIADLLVEMNGRVGQPSKQLVATSREVIRTLVTAMLITLLPTTI
jgi:hypothetical protein